METKQEEQARQMAELLNRDDHLHQENDRLWGRLEEDRGENARGSSHPAPPVKHKRGKEPILLGGSDAVVDDELSSGSSPLPDLSPLKNNMEAESRKRSPAPFQLFCQCRASPGTKRNQQRATTVRAGPQKCAHVA